MATPKWSYRGSLRIDDRGIQKVMRMMMRLPQAARDVAYLKALKPPALIVAERMRELTPQSKQNPTGGREKWSKKVQAKFGSMPRLHQSVKIKIISNKRSGASPKALIGYDYLAFGQTIYWNHPWESDVRAHHMWPTPTNPGPHAIYRKAENWVKRASDETRPQQIAAFRKAFTKAFQKEVAKLAKKA